jgi:cytochrome c-type biogenesis protein CcmH
MEPHSVWIFAVVALAAAVGTMAFIAWPLVRPGKGAPASAEDADGKLQSQLATIDADRSFSLIDEESAVEARREARAVAVESLSAPEFGSISRVGRFAAIACLGVVPLATAFLYFAIGAPEAFNPEKTPPAAAATPVPNSEQTAAIAAMPDEERRAMIEQMVGSLAERLKAEPNDPDGWRMLARSYAVLGRSAESAAAWRELLKREEGGADDWRQYAYELANDREAGDTNVSEEMEAAFIRLREFDADDPLALFVLGHAAYNRGDKASAKVMWMRLKEILPPETPISPTLDQLLEELR